MWAVIAPLILKAVPWQAIFGIIIKVVFSIWDKKKEYEEAKKLMLKLIDEVDRQAPIKVRDAYRRDIEILREQVRREDVEKNNTKNEAHTYKKAYHDLLLQVEKESKKSE